MAIKTFNRAFSKDNGSTNKVKCPNCAQEVEMRLFENIDVSPLAYILGKDASEDFAVCPNCAGIFSVCENYIREYKNGTTCYITPEDLKKL